MESPFPRFTDCKTSNSPAAAATGMAARPFPALGSLVRDSRRGLKPLPCSRSRRAPRRSQPRHAASRGAHDDILLIGLFPSWDRIVWSMDKEGVCEMNEGNVARYQRKIERNHASTTKRGGEGSDLQRSPHKDPSTQGPKPKYTYLLRPEQDQILCDHILCSNMKHRQRPHHEARLTSRAHIDVPRPDET